MFHLAPTPQSLLIRIFFIKKTVDEGLTFGTIVFNKHIDIYGRPQGDNSLPGTE